MPEAICDTTGATTEREAWREVEGAEGPVSAAFLCVLGCETATRDLRAVGGLLAHLAASDTAAEDNELDLLARVTAEAAEVVGAAFNKATELLRPSSQAERAAVEAEAERRRNDPARMEAGALAVTKAALAELRRCRELRRQQRAEAAGDGELEDGPPLPPLPEPAWLPAARAEGARLAAEGLHGRELGFTHGDVRLVRWLAARVAEADGAEAGERLLALAGIAAADAPA